MDQRLVEADRHRGAVDITSLAAANDFRNTKTPWKYTNCTYGTY